MLKQLKSMIDSGKLTVRIVRNKMVIELPEAVLFASGRAKLKKDGIRVLAELGPVLASLQGREFQVGGHTDNKPIKTKRFPSNWELSGARDTASPATASRPPPTPTPNRARRTRPRKGARRTVASRSLCSQISTSFRTSPASRTKTRPRPSLSKG